MNREIFDCLAHKFDKDINEIKLLPLTPDASSRSYFRFQIQKNTIGILCLSAPFVREEHTFLRLREVWSDGGIKVPKILFVEPRLGLVLQEDLGDISLQSFVSGEKKVWTSEGGFMASINQNLRHKLSDLIFDDLVKIRKLPKSDFFYLFDRSKLGFEWGWTWQHLVEPSLAKEDFGSLSFSWCDFTEEISKLLESSANTPTHRDLHSRNIMIKEGVPFYIDFQDGRLGTCYYDIISYLYDSYLPFDEDLEGKMLERYHSITGLRFDSRLYYCQVLQRTLKAAGSFAGFDRLKGDSRYVPYIGPTLTLALRALANLNTPKTAGVQRLITKMQRKYLDENS